MDLLVIAYIQEQQRRHETAARADRPVRSARRAGRLRRRSVA